MGRKHEKNAAEYISNAASKITAYLNNITIYKKFMLILVLCVFIPILLSCVAFSILTTNYVKNIDESNLQNASETTITALRNVFDEAVAITNTIAADSDLTEMAEIQFKDELDYYKYTMGNSLASDADLFITLKEFVSGIEIYINNDTISNGGVTRRIDDSVRGEKWYKSAEQSDNIISVCVNNGENLYDGTGERKVISIVRRITRGVVGGGTIGYVKADIDTDKLAYIMSRFENVAQFYLINYDEDIIYDVEAKDFVNGIDGLKKRTDSQYMTLEKGFDNVNYMRQWALLGTYNTSGRNGNQVSTVIMIIVLNLLVGLFMALIVVLIYKSFSHSINVIMVAMREIETGKFNKICMNMGEDELGILAKTYNHMVEKIETLINNVYKLEINNKIIETEKARAELNFLQSQINPHFIFNVLNAMLVVSVKNGYTDLSEQISGLAKMFRRLLDWSEEREPLSTEMKFIETYLKLEKFRFGDVFGYNISMDPNAGECKIPKMIVQPIVENACKHGLRGVIGKRELDVSSELNDNVLTIKVRDNGTGIEEEKLKQLISDLDSGDFDGHIGLKNVYRRLKIYFDDNADLEIESGQGEGTTVTIRIDYNGRTEDEYVQDSDS